MSVGFLFTAKLSDQNEFTDKLRKTAEDFGGSFYGQDQWASVRLCPMGNISFSFEADERASFPAVCLTADANTSLAGPGFHAAAIEFTDELVRRCDLQIHMEDETEYYEKRDFERMRQDHFYTWLAQLITICQEQLKNQGISTVLLCWDVNQYHPQAVDDSVVTPCGRFSLSRTAELIAKNEVQSFAERFFIWHDQEQNASYYRNQALAAMWEQCHFMPGSRSEADRQMNSYIIGCIEQAARMNPAIALPKAEYQLLCQLQEQTPADLSGHPDYETDYPIGYLRSAITQHIGNMDVTMPGHFLYELNDDSMLWYGGEMKNWKTLRISAFRSRDETADFSPSLFHGCAGDLQEFEAGDLRGRAAYAGPITQEDGAVFHQSIAQILCGSQVMLITASYELESDAQWAMEIFQGIKGRSEVTQ